MASLIPNYQFKDFKGLSAADLQRIVCCEIYDGETYLFTLIRPGTAYIRSQVENAGQLSNSVAGEDLNQITGTLIVSSDDPWENAEVYVSDKPVKVKEKKKGRK